MNSTDEERDGLTRLLSVSVWRTAEMVPIALGVLAVLFMPLCTPEPASFAPAAVAGVTGGLVVKHLSLHGWTFFVGTASQRAVLAGVWALFAIAGGTLAQLVMSAWPTM